MIDEMLTNVDMVGFENKKCRLNSVPPGLLTILCMDQLKETQNTHIHDEDEKQSTV